MRRILLQVWILALASMLMAACGGSRMEQAEDTAKKLEQASDKVAKTIQVLIASRFIVTAEGSQVTIGDLQAAMGKIDLAKLESRKDEGVQR